MSLAIQTVAPAETTFASSIVVHLTATASGSLLILCVGSDNNAAVTTVTDSSVSGASPWAQIDAITGATTFAPTNGSIWYRPNAPAGITTITATLSPSATHLDVVALEYPASLANTLDAHITATNSAQPPTPGSGNFTTTHHPDLVIGFCIGFIGGAGSGFALETAGGSVQYNVEDASGAAAGTQNANWVAGFSGWMAFGAAFYKSGGAITIVDPIGFGAVC